MGLRSLPTRDLIPATTRLSQFPRDPPLGGADGRRLPENRRRERSGDPVPRFVSVPPPAVRSHPIRRCHRAAGQWAGRTTRHGAAPHGHPAPPALCLKGQCLKGHIRRCGWGHCVESGTLRGKFCSCALTYPFLYHPPFQTKPLSLLPLNSRLCPRVSDAGGDSNCAIQEAALCSGARLRAVTAKRPQPRPRGRGANREQQRGRRKLGPPSGWATEAAGGERGRGHSARPQPYSLRGPGPRLALVTASSCARVWGRLGIQLES